MNQFSMLGRLEQIIGANGRRNTDPDKQPSVIIVVQYGPSREPGNGAVEFVNAALIRVPGFRYAKIADRLTVGDIIAVNGHIQGINKKSYGNEGGGIFTNELVADNIRVGAINYLFDTEDAGSEDDV
jgi:hypothetical protein